MKLLERRSATRREALLATFSLLPAAQLLRAQFTDSKTPSFSSSVDVINVFATVREKNGKLLTDLTKDDFLLSEDDRPQVIRYFSKQTDLPLTVGLLLDTSGSMRRMLDPEKEASRTFLQNVLRPDKDNAFLIHFDREVELLQDITNSREKLEKALDGLDRPDWGHSANNQSGGTDNPQPGDAPDNPAGGGRGGYGRRGGGRRGGGSHGGTQLYDAIYLASDDVLKKQGGRKALILLTDGMDRGSKISLSEAISTAQRADTLVYSIHIVDEEGGGSRFGGFTGPGMGRRGGMGRGPSTESRPDGKKILEQISHETGGAYFEYSKKKTIGDIYAQVEEELRNQYSLGYTSDQPNGDGSFRNIRVTLRNKKNLTVQARQGYYATKHA